MELSTWRVSLSVRTKLRYALEKQGFSLR
jgi:hypothetical protein